MKANNLEKIQEYSLFHLNFNFFLRRMNYGNSFLEKVQSKQIERLSALYQYCPNYVCSLFHSSQVVFIARYFALMLLVYVFIKRINAQNVEMYKLAFDIKFHPWVDVRLCVRVR